MQITLLRQERLNKGWTLEYVGQQIGVSNQAVSLIETGKQKPSYGVLLKLLTLFNVEHEKTFRLFAPVEETQVNFNTTGKEDPAVAAAKLSEVTPSVMVAAAKDLQDGRADTPEGRRVLELMEATGGAALR
jgi:transcriptional regulator with XRE-family HTH domain